MRRHIHDVVRRQKTKASTRVFCVFFSLPPSLSLSLSHSLVSLPVGDDHVPVVLLSQNTVENECTVFSRLELETRQIFAEVVNNSSTDECMCNALW